MADIPQVLATYGALVGVALGAGLTYGFGALNRRHQEAREDATRWYEVRLKTYIDVVIATNQLQVFVVDGAMTPEDMKARIELMLRSHAALHLVASDKVQHAFLALQRTTTEVIEGRSRDFEPTVAALAMFQIAAREDLGHS